MAEHFYLVASLPFLRLGEAPPVTSAELEALCARWLSEGEMKQLRCARIDIESIPIHRVRNSVLLRWIAFENSLRNQIVALRAQRLGVAPEAHIRRDLPWEPWLVTRMFESFGSGSPLETEEALLELRWRFLSDQEAGHLFDLDALVIYALKIQLMERRARFDAAEGRRVLRGILRENSKDERA